MKYLIVFYGKEKRSPEIYYMANQTAAQEFIERVVELARNKSLFTVNIVGECIGDFS